MCRPNYTLMAWHPGVGTILEKKVTVPAKERLKPILCLILPRDAAAPMKSKRTHFGPDSLGKTLDIRPTLELQKP